MLIGRREATPASTRPGINYAATTRSSDEVTGGIMFEEMKKPQVSTPLALKTTDIFILLTKK